MVQEARVLDGRETVGTDAAHSHLLNEWRSLLETFAVSRPIYAFEPAASFQQELLTWGTPEKLRNFPWRDSTDRYRLLISELMLRRTQAIQVVGVYLRFIDRWPDLDSFLDAKDEEVISTLQPLGLRWRASNLLQIRDTLKLQGRIPDTYEQLTALPGVGHYVASAVLCFSHTECRALIDTNTVRVICRFFVSFRQVHLFSPAAPALCSREHTEGVIHGALDRMEPDPGTNS